MPFIVDCLKKLPDVENEEFSMFKDIFENLNDQSFVTKLVLKETGLIAQVNDTEFTVTKDGLAIENLDLNLYASLAFAEANRTPYLAQLLPLVALFQVGDLRYNQRERMWNLPFVFSDYLYQLQVITHYFWGWYSMNLNARRIWVGRCNLSPRKFEEFLNVLEDLEQKTQVQADFNVYRLQEATAEQEQFLQAFKLSLFRAQIFETYPYLKEGRGKFLTPAQRFNEREYYQAEICHTSTTNAGYRQNIVMASGNIRMIAPKEKQAFAVLDLITLYTDYDIRLLENRFGREAILRIANISKREHELYYFLNPFKRARADYERTIGANENEVIDQDNNPRKSSLRKRPRGRDVGSFGRVLGDVLLQEELKTA